MNKIFLRYYTQNTKVFRTPGGREYFTLLRNRISLVEIFEEDLEWMLSQKCGCCENRKPCFTIATLEEVRQWRE